MDCYKLKLLDMKKVWLVITGITLLVATACKKESGNSGNGATVLLDVAYGTDAKQRLDVHLPANRSTTTTPVVFMIHGGAWTSGDKADFAAVVDSLKARMPDYAIVNTNYRLATLTGTNLWPTQINDINSAYQFVTSEANNYQINVSKTAFLGASAGAHLAMLKAYTANANRNIKCVVNLFGPTNMIDLFNNPPDPTYPQLLTIFMSGTPSSNLMAYTNASPLFFANATSAVPTAIFHGTADNVVPIRQSDSLFRRLQIAGVQSSFTVYQGAGHGWSGANMTDTYNKSIFFMRSNLQ
ncbi:MAG: alpha/beta hydrolase [Bacteroidetes bacterium]|nr:MAG: alpha/beta hydrolase [Bacteroidota bacterium]